ncbi:hypothetical protein DRJ48_01720 [Candidatus Woesearchaeota archaeon]|nr:hypothetical protein [Candidatus Woesearchaeota archaeon]RLE43141.1 MAG: hypothetical protein DRJ48_01720 [Candidatus Woesearchaeota archaeon]
MKRAQVTFFIVLALAILIIVGLLVALKSPLFKRPKVPDLPPKIEPVKLFVQKCLFDATIKGLRLLGEQGGVIYESQGGFVPDSFKTQELAVKYDDEWIWYSILPGAITYNISCSPKDLATGRYAYERCPSITFPFYGEHSDQIVFGLGDTSIIAHDINGNPVKDFRLLNQVNLPGLYEREEPARSVAWLQSLLSPKMKIRPNLAEFIKNNITKCLNFSELAKKGLSVTPIGEMSINPVFSEEFTRVEMSYPLRVVQNRTGQVTIINKFSATTKVRFGKIYKYVNDILTQEAQDYSYNLSSTLPRDGIRLDSLIKDINPKKVDIVVFIDPKSWILNKSGEGFVNYRFFGAIPNSPPAISYIHYRDVDAVPGLKAYLAVHCGLSNVFSVPMDNRLSVGVFRHMNRGAVECIFDAYRNLTATQGKYRPAYDPDDDKLGWSFKTSTCDWDEPCEYSNEQEFDSGMKTFLTIRFYEIGNEEYDDYLTIPLHLYNYPPTDIKVECVGENAGWYVYKISAKNMESPHQDPLNLSIRFTGASLNYHISSSSSTPTMKWWFVWFENATGVYPVRITVTDSFGATNSTLAQIRIPC